MADGKAASSDTTGCLRDRAANASPRRLRRPDGNAQRAGEVRRRRACRDNEVEVNHHRFVIGQLLDHIEELEKRIETFESRIEALNGPFKAAVTIVDSIPAISTTAANAIVSEIGTDMSRFRTAGHLASWLGLCPGNNESGGKRLSGKTRNGNHYARAALVQVAHVACRMRATQYYGLYGRIAARRGKKRAIIAVAHAVVVTIHHLLTTGALYAEPGPDYLLKINPEREFNNLKRRASRFGYELTPVAQAA